MPDSCTHVYVHVVWATHQRRQLIKRAIEPAIYAAIRRKCDDLKCQCVAIGGTDDHVHVLVRLNAAVSVSELTKGIKGSSSHLVSHELDPDGGFKWQVGYGAFSVSADQTPRVRDYIAHQKERHARGDLYARWESPDGMVASPQD